MAIPTLPERAGMLARALASVEAQTLAPADIRVNMDAHRSGIAVTRNQLLAQVKTEFVAWLDDDDELYPHHLSVLAGEIDRTGADLVYPDYEVVGGGAHRPSFIQVTHLSRTEVLRSVGGFPEPFSDEWPYRYEDWGMLAKLLNRGAKFHYVPVVTWRYHIHGENTVGTGF